MSLIDRATTGFNGSRTMKKALLSLIKQQVRVRVNGQTAILSTAFWITPAGEVFFLEADFSLLRGSKRPTDHPTDVHLAFHGVFLDSSLVTHRCLLALNIEGEGELHIIALDGAG